MAHSNSYAKTRYTHNAPYGCICTPTTIYHDCAWCNAQEEAEEEEEERKR